MENDLRPPIEVKYNWAYFKRLLYKWIVCVVLTVILFAFSLFLFITYFVYVCRFGWYNENTVRIAVYIVIGSYFFLIVDKKKIEELLGLN